jgi:putative nucleotidyltransferase with HDIG domain
MYRILFVHDDPRLCERVLRSLATREPEWEIQSATREDDAWSIVRDWEPSAIVAAARPPAMDGLRLLTRVRDLRTDTVRIVVGVDADAEHGLRTLRLAHRALPDPFEVPALHEMLKRMLLLSEVVAQPSVRKILAQIGTLPAVPSVYTRLSRRLDDPNASVYELSEMIAADATLAVQVLRIANSAYFGRNQRVTRLESAAARLGTRLLRSLVLMAEVYGRFPVSPFIADRLEALQEHASMVAKIASKLEVNAPWRDDAFTAGLLHDIGKLLLASHMSDVHTSFVREAERTGSDEFEVELQRLGIHHGTLGACMLGMWGLPSVVLDAARSHHAPLLVVPDKLDAVLAVTIADHLAHAAISPPTVRGHRLRTLEMLSADPRWPRWSEIAVEATHRQSEAA